MENIKIIELLLSKEDIDVNVLNEYYYDDGGGEEVYWKYYPLYESVQIGNIEIIKLLLSNKNIYVNDINVKLIDYEGGGEPDEGKWYKTALYRAVEKENIDIIKLLLDRKETDIDISNMKTEKEEDGDILWRKTAFYKAVENENIDIIKLLLKYDFDINILNFDCGFSDESDPRKNDVDDQPQSLRDSSADDNSFADDNSSADDNSFADDNSSDYDGSSADDNSSDYDDSSADDNSSDYDDSFADDFSINNYKYGYKTALYLAVLKKNENIIELLLTNPNIDLNITNTNRENKNTVLDLAQDIKKPRIINLLDNYEKNKSKIDIQNDTFNIENKIKSSFKISENPTFKTIKYFNKIIEKMLQEIGQIIEKNGQKNINSEEIQKALSFFFDNGFLQAITEYINDNKKMNEKNIKLSVDVCKNYYQNKFSELKIDDDAYTYLSVAMNIFINRIISKSKFYTAMFDQLDLFLLFKSISNIEYVICPDKFIEFV